MHKVCLRWQDAFFTGFIKARGGIFFIFFCFVIAGNGRIEMTFVFPVRLKSVSREFPQF